MVESLKESRRWCAKFCRRSRSSFVYSFALLDTTRRQAMFALYAFARITDDLGDSPQPPEKRAAQIACWRRLLAENCGSSSPQQLSEASATQVPIAPPTDLAQIPLWPALRDAVARYEIPVRLLEDIVLGVSMDIEQRQPADWLELRHYCYHVASAVGLACTHIWRADRPSIQAGHQLENPLHVWPVESKSLVQSAIDCGLAFQLTNILRDVAEDARSGRIYLPRSDFHDYNIDREQWLAGQPNGEWDALLDHTANRARELYASGWNTIEDLTPASQRMFSLMWRSYRCLLESVVQNKQRLWAGKKIRLPQRQRIRLLTSHFLMPIDTRLQSP